MRVVLGFSLVFVHLGLEFCVFFWFSLDYFVLVLFAFVVLDLVSSVLRQEIGWADRLRNDLFCIEWDVKPKLRQSVMKPQMCVRMDVGEASVLYGDY